MSFKTLPILLRVYILLTITAGMVALGTLFASVDEPPNPLLITLLVLCSVIFGTWRVSLTIRGGVMTLTSAVVCLSMLLSGAGSVAAVLCAAVGAAIGTVVRPTPGHWFPRFDWRTRWYRTAFNVAICVLAAVLAANCFDFAESMLSNARGAAVGRNNLMSVVVIGTTCFQIVYFLANTLGVSATLAILEKKNLFVLWRENFLWSWPSYFASGSIAVGISAAFRNPNIGTWALLLLPPVYFIYYSYRLYAERTRLYVESVEREIRHVKELNDLNSAIIASLATAIDAKDRYTRSHINRVQAYSVALAESVGLSGLDLEAVRTGALIHDIGKLGIPESILAKPGKLTPDEFRVMQSHVKIGAEILAPVGFPYPVIPIVLTHHERWDGLGYPEGLRGEEIPIGGRIMAIADVFDALTSDRPYRRAMTPDEALSAMRKDAGRHFDPTLVERFAEVLPKVLGRVAQLDAQTAASSLPFAATSASDGDRQADEGWLRETAATFADLLRASHHPGSEVEVAEEVTAHLLACFPADTAVLYLHDAEREWLRAVAVRGRFAEQIEGLEMELGRGVSGWVAARQEPQLNAQALLDLGPCFTPGDKLDLTAVLATPLVYGAETVGVLALYSSSYNTLRRHHQVALSRIAEYASAALVDLRRWRSEGASDSAAAGTRHNNGTPEG